MRASYTLQRGSERVNVILWLLRCYLGKLRYQQFFSVCDRSLFYNFSDHRLLQAFVQFSLIYFYLHVCCNRKVHVPLVKRTQECRDSYTQLFVEQESVGKRTRCRNEQCNKTPLHSVVLIKRHCVMVDKWIFVKRIRQLK